MAKGESRSLFYFAGQKFLSLSQDVGALTLFIVEIITYLLPPRMDRRELWRNLYKVGVKSFVIVVITALLTGAIMVVQTALYIEKYGAHGMLGWGAGYSVFREIGPLLIGLMFSGRVGANNTAELGTMIITEQVDALRALAIDPFPFLIIPRLVSIIFMMFLLIIIGDLTALIAGAITSQYLVGVDMLLFYQSIVTYLKLSDFFHGVIKAVAFGTAIGIISCFFGMSVRGGAVGVGNNVNNSVVTTAIAIFLLDYFITYILT